MSDEVELDGSGQKAILDEGDADEIFDAVRSLVLYLTPSQKARLREGKAYVSHVNARHMRRLLDIIEPPPGAE